MHHPTRLVDKRLQEISSEGIRNMIVELAHAAHVAPDSAYTLWNFLTQCVYPIGDAIRRPIDKNLVIPGGLLSRKIGKLEGSDIYQVCDEIARVHGQTAEIAVNMSLYVFLNKYLPNFEKRVRPKPTDPRNMLRWLKDE